MFSVIWRKTRKWSRVWQWRCWNAVDLNASISCESCAHIWEAELRFMRTVVTLLSLAGYGVPALPWPEYGTRDPLHNPLLHILFPPCQFFASLCPKCLFVSLWRIDIKSFILWFPSTVQRKDWWATAAQDLAKPSWLRNFLRYELEKGLRVISFSGTLQTLVWEALI